MPALEVMLGALLGHAVPVARPSGSGTRVLATEFREMNACWLVAQFVARGQERGILVLVDPKIPHIDYHTGRDARAVAGDTVIAIFALALGAGELAESFG